jgi:hypothetical protein
MSRPIAKPLVRPSVRALCAFPFLIGCAVAPGVETAPVPDSGAIARHIGVLAADSLEGRRTGTPQNDAAASWLASRLRDFGLAAVTPNAAGCATNGGCDPSFLQSFVARPARGPHDTATVSLPTRNVMGLVRGTDPVLRNQFIVVGAHFDHLGRSTTGALDPDKGAEIRNGADDNASGTAAVLELARLLGRSPPKRSVLFLLFSGEELGLLGSAYFVEHSPIPLDSVQAMINFDMVGRLRNDRLIVYGFGTASEWPSIISTANVAPSLAISPVADGFGPSDHSSFYAKGMPVLHFFTDLHEDYHRATDDADKIDAAGVARVVSLAERITRDIANRSGRLTFVNVPVTAPTRASATSGGAQAYLGSIPDMGAGDVVGLRITGVRAGSPADTAGLKGGDVIVQFAGETVTDLNTYSSALYAKKPGDIVEIVFLRDGKRLTTRVTLGRRGG